MFDAVLLAASDPNVTIAQWTIVAGSAAALTGLVAIVTLVHAGRDSRERTRPVVLVEYRVPPHAYRALELVVRNAGVSMARHLTVSFDPPLEEREDDDLIRRSILDRYGLGIPALGPGQELTNIVTFDSEDDDKSDLPAKLKVKVVYRRGRWRWYEDVFPLVADVYKYHTYQTSSASPEGQLKKIGVSTTAMAASLKSIAKSARTDKEEADATTRHRALLAQHEALVARVIPQISPDGAAEERPHEGPESPSA